MRKLYLLSLLTLLFSLLTACSNNSTKQIESNRVVNSAAKNIKQHVVPSKTLSDVKIAKAPARKVAKAKPVARKKYTPRKQQRKAYPKKVYPRNIRKNYQKRYAKKRYVRRITPSYPRRAHGSASFARSLSNAAMARTRHNVRYDGRYVKLAYPWGDVPANIGVCTDVVIRSYRRLGIDLQKAVHEDMSRGGFYDYPQIKKWKLSAPDKNIDHRRVYNLQAFFRRHGAALPISRNPRDYRPGDLVTWMVGPGLPHIGVVVEQRSKADPRRHMIVHNIAHGPKMEDILFAFRITGHYRYTKNNKLIAGRRFQNNVASVKTDYARLMRELSIPSGKRKKKKHTNTSVINIAQLKSQSGISDADIQVLLRK